MPLFHGKIAIGKHTDCDFFIIPFLSLLQPAKIAKQDTRSGRQADNNDGMHLFKGQQEHHRKNTKADIEHGRREHRQCQPRRE